MYKVAIIGAGTAGKACQSITSRNTNNYVVIDKDANPVSKCSETACMPTKKLIAQAQSAQSYHSHFPSQNDSDNRNLLREALKASKEAGAYFSKREEESNQNWMSSHFIQGFVKLINENRLEVSGKQIECENIIIATGSSPRVPKGLDLKHDAVLTSESLWQKKDLSDEPVAILGSGVQGIEFATALDALGASVHLYGINEQFALLSEEELNKYYHKKLEERFKVSIGENQLKAQGDKISINTKGSEIAFKNVLLCTGSQSNLPSLGFENINSGVEEDGKIKNYDQEGLRIKNTNIFICGDASGLSQNIPTSKRQAHAICSKIFPKEESILENKAPKFDLNICFSIPQIATVGQKYIQLSKSKTNFKTAVASFEDQGRARLEDERIGFIHIYHHENRFLGMEAIGPRLENLSHLIAWSANLNSDIRDWKHLPIYHPVFEQTLNQIWEQIK
ncbi:FAD-dependent oxidoreductase [bacterium]|nr:FAD-dependent oxidoreductase [bacterium]